MYPTFLYHPVLAPQGRKFTDDDEFHVLAPEWVDTPAKFPAATAARVPAEARESATDDLATVPTRRSRAAKETVQ